MGHVKTERRMRRRRTPTEVIDEMQKLYPDLTRQDIIFRIHSNDLAFVEKVSELKADFKAKKQNEIEEAKKRREIADALLKGEVNESN